MPVFCAAYGAVLTPDRVGLPFTSKIDNNLSIKIIIIIIIIFFKLIRP